jgi:small subunit ribosomal protein S20
MSAGSVPSSLPTFRWFGGRQIDLVDHRDDGETGVTCQVVVGEGLRLQPLRGVDQQDRPLAGCQAPRDLVGEIDVSGRVDQVELVALVEQTDRLGLDRDAPLALQVHPIEVLRPHRALIDGVGELEHPVGQRGLPVVDMRHDAEVADAGDLGRHDTSMVRVRTPRIRAAVLRPPSPGRPARGWPLVDSVALMANIKSQIKRNRQNSTRHDRNTTVRSALKTSTKKVHAAVGEGDAEAAVARQREAARALDKAASKGVLHKRTAARKKSRLAKAVNKTSAA